MLEDCLEWFVPTGIRSKDGDHDFSELTNSLMPAAPEPSAAPTLAPGANSSANGTSPSHLTQIKVLKALSHNLAKCLQLFRGIQQVCVAEACDQTVMQGRSTCNTVQHVDKISPGARLRPALHVRSLAGSAEARTASTTQCSACCTST